MEAQLTADGSSLDESGAHLQCGYVGLSDDASGAPVIRQGTHLSKAVSLFERGNILTLFSHADFARDDDVEGIVLLSLLNNLGGKEVALSDSSVHLLP